MTFRTLALTDDDSDVDFSNGPRWVTGIEAYKVALLTRLRLFLGEWFLDQTAGVPWFQDFLGQVYFNARQDRILRDQILSSPGIDSITDLDLSFNSSTRMLTVLGEVRAVTGESFTINEVVSI